METPPETPTKGFRFEIIQPECGSKFKLPLEDVFTTCTSEVCNAASSSSRLSEVGNDYTTTSTDGEAVANSGVTFTDITSTPITPSTQCYILALEDKDGPEEEHVKRPSMPRSVEGTKVENLPLTPPDTPNTQPHCFDLATSKSELSSRGLWTKCSAIIKHIEHNSLNTASPCSAQTTSQAIPQYTHARPKPSNISRKQPPPRSDSETRSTPTESFNPPGIKIKAEHITTLLTPKRPPAAAPRSALSALYWLRPLKHRKKDRGSSVSLHGEDEGAEVLKGWGWKPREMGPMERAVERKRVLARKLVYYGKVAREGGGMGEVEKGDDEAAVQNGQRKGVGG